jgi:hypothetical protein
LEEVKMEEVFEAWGASHSWTLAALRGMEAFGCTDALAPAQNRCHALREAVLQRSESETMRPKVTTGFFQY